MNTLLLPTVKTGLFPSQEPVTVSLYPKDIDIKVALFEIGDLEPEEFFPYDVAIKN